MLSLLSSPAQQAEQSAWLFKDSSAPRSFLPVTSARQHGWAFTQQTLHTSLQSGAVSEEFPQSGVFSLEELAFEGRDAALAIYNLGFHNLCVFVCVCVMKEASTACASVSMMREWFKNSI